ncbi:MAG: hypothetical protein ABL921_31290 [Pirellula sp.]
MKAMLAVVVFFLWFVPRIATKAHGDESAIAKAREFGTDYALNAEFGIPQYLLKTRLKAYSSPDSPILYESIGEMVVLKSKLGTIERFKQAAKIITDDRPVRAPDLPTFANNEDWERITFDGKLYTVRDDVGNKQKPELVNEKYRRLHWVPQSECVELLDWPLLTLGSFRRGPAVKNLSNVYFGNNRPVPHECLAATEFSDGRVESYWGAYTKSEFIWFRVFKSGLLVRQEVLYYDKIFLPQEGIPDREKGIPLAIVNTTWGKLNDVDDVPVLVEAVLCDEPWKDKSTVTVIAKFDIYGESSTQFTNATETLKSLKSSIPDAKE